MTALPPAPLPDRPAAIPALVAQVTQVGQFAQVATPAVEVPPMATPSVPMSAGPLVTEAFREPTRAWGLSLGGGGGAGFTYRYNGSDGTGWTVAGSVVRIPVYQDNGLPHLLAGFKRHWILQETDRSRLYQSVGTSLLYNPYPSFNAPVTNAAGGGSQGLHTLGTGYGIQLDLAGGWKLGFEMDFGFAVLWPGSGRGLFSFILPMPELSLLYEY